MEDEKENILDIMDEIDANGDGDDSHLKVKVEKMEGEIVASNDISKWIEPLDPIEQQAADQARERDQQVEAAARGESPPQGPGQAPRVSDFFLIDTTMEPGAFMKLLNDEVLGHYDVTEHLGQAEFGMIVFRHVQGLPGANALPGGLGSAAPVKTRPMLVVKLDTGSWDWYDSVSMAILAAIVRRVDRRAWRCGWAIDKAHSWVEHWKPGKHGGDGVMTETIDGPANAAVTAKAKERWGIDVRSAFDDLMRVAQWEALRQWLITPEPRSTSFVAYVSFLAGKLLIQKGDHEWIVRDWGKFFPGRKPEDGPLHLQAYYVPIRQTKSIPQEQKVMDFRSEPKLLG